MSPRAIKESVGVFEASQLDDIRAFVRSNLLDTPLDRKSVTSVMLAVEEAVTNIHRHGYLLGEGTVRITLERRRDGLRIMLHDRGRPYVPPETSAPDASKLAETGRKGGLGAFLIDRVMDEVHRQSTADGENELLMAKRYGSGPSRPVPLGGMRARIALVTGAVVLLAVGSFTAFEYYQTTSRIEERQLAAWNNLASAARTAFAGHILNQRSDAEFDQLAVGIIEADSTLALVVCTDDAGRVLAHSGDPSTVHRSIDDLVLGRIATDSRSRQWTASTYDSLAVRLAVFPIQVGQRTIGELYLLGDASSIDSEQARAGRRVLIAGVIVLLPCWLALFLIAAAFVRPLAQLSERVRRAGEEGLEAVDANGEPDEIAEIIGSFNDATEKLRQSEREFARSEARRRELQIARSLQEALLPLSLPEIPGYRIATEYRAAQAVGGDYYDCFPIDDHRFVLSVADVSGKGFPAALVMTTVRTAVRLLAPRYPSPKELLIQLQEFCAGSLSNGMFVTVFHMLLDRRTNTIEFASAGHLPMLYYRHSEGRAFAVKPKGMPLGLILPDGVDFASRLYAGDLPVEPGDRWVLFSDGLTEARGRDKAAFGTRTIEELIAIEEDFSPQGCVDAIVDRWMSHVGSDGDTGKQQQDDLTLVVVERSVAESGRRLTVTRPQGEAMSASEPANNNPGNSTESTPDRIARWMRDHSGGGKTPDSIDRRDLMPLLEVIARHPEYDPPQVRLAIEDVQKSGRSYRDDEILRMLIELRLETLTYRRRFSRYVHPESEPIQPTH